MRKSHLIYFIYIVFNSLTLAQDEDSTLYQDTEYYTFYPNLSLHVRAGYAVSPFSITDKTNGKTKVSYKNNSSVTFGGGINYLGLGLSMGFSSPVVFKDENIYQKTSSLIICVDGSMKQLTVDMNGRFFKGYTQKNNLKRREYVSNYNLTALLRYTFNKNYSYVVAKGISGRYKKPVFTTYVGAKLTIIDITSPHTLLDSTIVGNQSHLTESHGVRSTGISALAGGCYVYQKKNFLIHVIFGGGLELSSQFSVVTNQENRETLNFSPKSDFKFNIGYNSPQYFAILECRQNSSINFSKENNLLNFYNQFILKVGYRFSSSRFPIEK